MVHQYRASLVVNLGIDTCITDEIDDPFLSLLMGKSQASRKVPVGGIYVRSAVFDRSLPCVFDLLDIDPLMDLAIRFRNEVAGCVKKRVRSGNEEKV